MLPRSANLVFFTPTETYSATCNVTATHPTVTSAAGIAPPPNFSANSSLTAAHANLGFAGSAVVHANDSCALCITGMANKASVPLFTLGTGIPFSTGPSGFNLFIKQSTPVTPYEAFNPPLFVAGSEGVFINNKWMGPSLPLWVQGFQYTSHEAMNLFIANKRMDNSVQLQIYGVVDLLTTISGALVPLYIHGKAKTSLNTPLFLKQNTLGTNKTLPLFIKGPLAFNKSTTLYTAGGMLTHYSKSTNLYLWAGDGACEYMNLFVRALPPASYAGNNPLVVTGSVFPSQHAVVPLSIVGSQIAEYMNLVIQGKDHGGTSKVLRLMVVGGNPLKGGVTPLYVHNTGQFLDDGATLYVRGLGQNPGYMPQSESVNLFVQRGPNAGITFYVENKSSAVVANLFINGVPALSDSLPLIMAGEGREVNMASPLCVTGEEFYITNSATTLVVPGTVGFVAERATLYINGFEY